MINRIRWAIWIGIGALGASAALAQDADYRVEPLAEAAPETFSPAIRATLNPAGVRIFTKDGKPFMDVWLRKDIPASKAPGAADGAVQFPFLAEGTLLGAIRYAAEGRDIRDQTIIKGEYTLRYGLQPVDGNHLGVSPFRDFALMLPGEQDQALAPPDMDALFGESAKVSGTEHPATLMLFARKPDDAAKPAIRHDQEKAYWGVMLLAQAAVESAGKSPFALELIIDGVAE
jgi:hypothetical protein